jgi:RNA 3'-terminal phosphate cyclase (ATP)
MHEIDGAYGEGGGQLLRTSVALAAITGRPVHLRNIRARRANPGLAPQHLAAVEAVASLCDAQVDGLELRSREIWFRPGPLRGGQFDFRVGTAGSITLVLQAVLPVAVMCPERTSMRIAGGTDVRAAPPLDYFRHVLLPLISGMGVRAKIDVWRRGYYPRGGGEVFVEVKPSSSLQPLILATPGILTGIQVFAHIANLPGHISQRMVNSALAELTPFSTQGIELERIGRDRACGPGGAVVLVGQTENTRLGASAVAQRGMLSEELGAAGGRFLREEIVSGGTLDVNAADQVLVYLALAGRTSRFLTRLFSSHAVTTVWLLKQFLPVNFQVRQVGRLICVTAEPGLD